MILGLDISSTKTGVCCIGENGDLILLTYIETPSLDKKAAAKKEKSSKRKSSKPKKVEFEDIFDKISYIKEYFENFYETYPDIERITEIHIEEPLSKFAAGKSSIQTLKTLFQVNYSISFELYRIFNIKPIYWHPTSARTANGIKIKRGTNAKEIVLNEIKTKIFPELRIQENLSKTSPIYDALDAAIIARAGWLAKKSNQ